MGDLKGNFFINGLILVGASGNLYLILLIGYMVITNVIDFIEALVS